MSITAGFSYNMMVGKMLYLQVLDYDRFSRHHPIGEVSLPLIDVNLARGETIWMDLLPCQIHAVRLLQFHVQTNLAVIN